MSILEIRVFPDPVLKEVSKEVTKFDKELHKFLDEMKNTMYAANGIGLASPQVGVLKRATVIHISEETDEPLELINPQIISKEGMVSSEEGCLSIPEYRDTVKRSEKITVKSKDRFGNDFQIDADGLLAICIQHEIDHLDGILFIDRLSRLKRELFKRWFKKRTSGEKT